MSQFKIFILNNYLIVQCDDPLYNKQALAKDVFIQPVDSTNPVEYDFFNFDNQRTKWNTILLEDMVDENDTPYNYDTWTDFYTKNTGNFNSGGGGSSSIEKNGKVNINTDGSENVLAFSHGLIGANWVQLQYRNPEQGDIYLSDIDVNGMEVFINSDNPFPAGLYEIYYKVAIIDL